MQFAPGTRTVQLRVGISFVDGPGAARNLAAEVPGFDFDQTRQAAAHAWRLALSRVELWGASASETERIEPEATSSPQSYPS